MKKKLIAILLSLFIVVSPFFANAGLPAPVINYAVSVGNVLKQAGSSIRATVAFRSAANDALYTATANVSRQSVAQGVLGRFATLGTGLVGGAVLVGLLEGLDWVMDPENNTIQKKKFTSGVVFCSSGVIDSTCKSSVQDYLSSVKPDKTETLPDGRTRRITNATVSDRMNLDDVIETALSSEHHQRGTIRYTDDYFVSGLNNHPDTNIQRENGLSFYVHPFSGELVEDMKADDLAQLFDKLSNDELAQLMQPDPNLEPSLDPMYDVYDDISEYAEPDANPDPNTNECADGFIKIGNYCYPESDPDPDPDPVPDAPFELPLFCSWAEPVCIYIDFIKDEYKKITDFFTEPMPQAIPSNPVIIEDLSEEQIGDWRGMAEGQYITMGGQCPDDVLIPINYMGASSDLTVSYVPFCHFATLIRPAVILGAWISGLLLVVAGRAKET